MDGCASALQWQAVWHFRWCPPQPLCARQDHRLTHHAVDCVAVGATLAGHIPSAALHYPRPCDLLLLLLLLRVLRCRPCCRSPGCCGGGGGRRWRDVILLQPPPGAAHQQRSAVRGQRLRGAARQRGATHPSAKPPCNRQVLCRPRHMHPNPCPNPCGISSRCSWRRGAARLTGRPHWARPTAAGCRPETARPAGGARQGPPPPAPPRRASARAAGALRAPLPR